jgi:NAD(P)-dependent dehydrogenase (short-subunit alcohol dehydrogenase family)
MLLMQRLWRLVHFWSFEWCSLIGVQLAASKVSKATGGTLDYLINNAGKANHPGFTLDQL